MTTDPDEPTRHVPVTEVIPRHIATPPARRHTGSTPEQGHSLPASMPVLPSPRRWPRLPWLIGVGAGIGGARLLTALIGWPTIISSQAIAVAFLFSLIVGIFFGLYPANKASKLNPIDALHYE